MNAKEELSDWLRLTLTPGIGGQRQRLLLRHLGMPQQIFSAGYAALSEIVGGKLARALLDTDPREALKRVQAWLAEDDNHLLTLADAAYPPSLLETPDPPVLLYVKGRLDALSGTGLAIVGARSATAGGCENAAAFARHLAAQGLTIISGLASGIDAAAHRGAIEGGGLTLAVIGTGADRIYPARNLALGREIVAHGAILSEFPLGTPAIAGNFPRRNRIISGLARGVLVVEAALASGSLITARQAAEQGREVFAIPGSIHSPLSRGCHALIRQGAKLVETSVDILEELGLAASTSTPSAPSAPKVATMGSTLAPAGLEPTTQAPPSLEPKAQAPTAEDVQVLAALGFDPLDVDTLVERTGLTVDALYAILLELELGGQLARLPGGRYQRLG